MAVNDTEIIFQDPASELFVRRFDVDGVTRYAIIRMPLPTNAIVDHYSNGISLSEAEHASLLRYLAEQVQASG